MAKRKQSSKAFWWILAGIIAIIAVFVFATAGGPDIDYSQYNYTDSEAMSQNASHVIEEFSDFQCPACQSYAPTLKAVKADFDVRIEYKHFPLDFHPYAQLAAEASECARDQERFWAYHDVLFDHQSMLAKANLIDYAEGLGLDMEAFKTCLDSRAKQTVVAQDKLEGERRGVQGTPTVFLDGEELAGNLRSYQGIASRIS